MIRLGLLLSAATLSITRVPVQRLVSWTSYQNGYSINTDLVNDSTHTPYQVQFDNNNYFIDSVSTSFYYTEDEGYYPTITRTFSNTSFTNNNTGSIMLLGYIRGVTNIQPLLYATDNGHYSYDSFPVGNDQQPNFALVSYNFSLHEIKIETNINSLQYNVSVDWYDSSSYQHDFFNEVILVQEDETNVSRTYTTSIPDTSTYFNINVVLNDLSNNDYYNDIYANGYTAGQEDGYQTGYNNGWQVGHDVGYGEGTQSTSRFADLLFTIADTPIYYLKSLFNFELFGINVAIAIMSLLSISIAVYIVKKVV